MFDSPLVAVFPFIFMAFLHFLRTRKCYIPFIYSAGASSRYYLFSFYYFSTGQMGPFGAWLHFTVYEEDTLFTFLLRPRCGIFFYKLIYVIVYSILATPEIYLLIL